MIAREDVNRHHLDADGIDPGAIGLLPPSALLFASNRGPVCYRTTASGQLQQRQGNGGVVTALNAAAARAASAMPVTWFSAAMGAGDRLAGRNSRLAPDSQQQPVDTRFVITDPGTFHLHYDVFCNPVLWFLQHDMWSDLTSTRSPAEISTAWYDGYVPVNKQFALSVAQAAESEARPFVLVQDYHLYVVPAYLRARVPRAMIAHFVHIPWPEPRAWQHLPFEIAQAIFAGLAASHLVGFQTPEDARQFLQGCRAYLEGSEVDGRGQRLLWRDRITEVRAYPISIDGARLQSKLYSPAVRAIIDRLRAQPHEQTIVRVDRLDPTKNVVRGFEALAMLLTERPELIGRIRCLAFLVPSRGEISEYARYRDDVMSAINAVNERFGTNHWKPVQVYYEDNYEQAIAALSLYDVLLVNPIADGMNLVAKEGPVLNQRNGVLVLSKKAGAWHQLQAGALAIDPLDVAGTARALGEALAMPETERARRQRLLRSAVAGFDVGDWLWRQIGDLASFQPRLKRETMSVGCRIPSMERAASRIVLRSST